MTDGSPGLDALAFIRQYRSIGHRVVIAPVSVRWRVKGTDMSRSTAVASVSAHARQRLAQRNLTAEDVQYVYAHGRLVHAGKAIFVYLGLRDIPDEDRRDDQFRRLEGTVLVLDPLTGCHLTTAYRNRRHGSRDIRRKPKWSLISKRIARSLDGF